MAQEGKMLGQDAHIGQVTIRSTDAQVGGGKIFFIKPAF